MGIRLNKVLTELNIGLQTAVDFLKNKKSLGQIREDVTPNTKISDQQYEALVGEFNGDKAVKTQAASLFPKKEKKKVEMAKTKTEEKMAQRQQFKPLGKIDLDSLGKPKPVQQAEPSERKQPTAAAPKDSKPQTEPKAAAESQAKKNEKIPAESVKTEVPSVDDNAVEVAPVAPQPAAKPAEEHKPAEEPKDAEKQKPATDETAGQKQQKAVEVQKPAPEDGDDDDDETDENGNEQPAAATSGPEIYTLKSEARLAPKVNVLGKIDLSTINQSTRPKKKSKEEKRKQREEKAAQQRGQQGGGQQSGEKRKRERIRGGKVDIEAAAKQQTQQLGGGQQGGGKKKNKGGNQNFTDAAPGQRRGAEGQQQGGKNKKNKQKQPVKPVEVNEEDVARQVKETLARLTSKTNLNKKGAKYRKEKRDAVAERLSEEMAAEAAQSKVLKLTEFVTVSELATMMNVPVVKVISTCMAIGIMASINQRLEAETINIVAEEFGYTTEYVSAEVQNAIQEEADDENDLLPRAPIVTVMGHVDHGKTSLLDYIRKTNVIAGEAGGITQHIGAYNVTLPDGRQITFLDTPGHEAFTAMRARGAQVTDIAIIIVAADDSVMPTTKEAIAHAQAANVPMVFAINKIDKPGANPDKIREDLANMNLLVEEWGGKYQCQEISAKKGIGVEELLEKVLLEAEMLDLKANPNRKATGSIIESSLDKGRGYFSTVLVSNGTLKVGEVVISGT